MYKNIFVDVITKKNDYCTLIGKLCFRMLRKEKIMIHTNLSIALMLAQIVFVSSSDAYRNQVGA